MTARLSVRARLLLAVFVIALVALVLSDVVVYGQLRSNLYNQVDNSLEAAHPAIEAAAEGLASERTKEAEKTAPSQTSATTAQSGARPAARNASPELSTFCALARQNAPGMFVEVLDAEGGVVTGSSGRESCAALEPGNTTISSPVLSGHLSTFSTPAANNESVVFFTASASGAGEPGFRVRAQKLTDGDILVLALPVTEIAAALEHTFFVELLVTAAALAAAIALGIWLVRVGLHPLRDIERAAEVIAGGDLVHRVPNPNPRTEVGHLATAFNVMVDRIEALVTNLRASENRLLRFVGDASHELRTPIAAVSAYAQLFEHKERVTPEDLARIMDGIRRETTRMARLVEDLLVLAKLDEQRPLQQVPVEVVGLVGEGVETANVVGPSWPVRLEAAEPVEVLGDPTALRQVIDNLLANVRAHTPEGTETAARVLRDGDRCVIEIADNGPGITEEQAALVFERFFRADPSRSRLSGGAGLGLAIVASIVAQHGGTAEALSRKDTGALFRIVLPALAHEWGAPPDDTPSTPMPAPSTGTPPTTGPAADKEPSTSERAPAPPRAPSTPGH